MENDFEKEVISRLVRIETEQQYIRQDISAMKALEERVSNLEASDNQRKGVGKVLAVLIGLLSGGLGSVCGVLFGRGF